MTAIATPYLFHNADLVAEQLDALTAALDPWTKAGLLEAGIMRGAKTADAGAGSGTIAAFIAGLAGETGTTVAVDISLQHLPPYPGVTVVKQDLATGGLPGSGYDLIHSRLLTIHMPRRIEMIQNWVQALAPGGMLMLHEFDCTAPRRVYGQNPADETVFAQVNDGISELLRLSGAHLAWGSVAHNVLRQAGLTDVKTVFHAETFRGGQPWARWAAINTTQMQDRLLNLSLGITADDLDRFRELMADPAFEATSYLAARITGRRPNR